MDPESLVRDYLAALASADIDKMNQLFAPNGLVHSPLYGTMPASQFYPQLFARTSSSRLGLKGVFRHVSQPHELIFYFSYEWTLSDGSVGHFDVCDVVRAQPESGKIVELTIIYDTVKAPRAARDDVGSNG